MLNLVEIYLWGAGITCIFTMGLYGWEIAKGDVKEATPAFMVVAIVAGVVWPLFLPFMIGHFIGNRRK